MLVEVCANSLESALIAQKAGADRIELCTELASGGITPSYGLLKAVREQISIPVRVLVRPRSGNFTYSDEEMAIMKRNIGLCAELNFQGVVSGALNADFTLDRDKTRELIEKAGAMNFTFHRAFDWVKNPEAVQDELEEMGVDTILTSGQQASAVEGLVLLSSLRKRPSNITIMPGSGINEGNVHMFKESGFDVIHLSGAKMRQILPKKPKIAMSSPKMISDRAIPISSSKIIKAVVDLAK